MPTINDEIKDKLVEFSRVYGHSLIHSDSKSEDIKRISNKITQEIINIVKTKYEEKSNKPNRKDKTKLDE